jgi:hypothetical protein
VSQATNCTAGHYCPIQSMVALKCPPGTYQPAGNQSSCVTCPTGSYCDVASMTAGLPCPGHLICGLGAVRGSRCGPGLYATGNNCVNCPAGHWCWPTPGAMSPIAPNVDNGIIAVCAPGYVCQGGSSNPKPTINIDSIIAGSDQFLTYNG